MEVPNVKRKDYQLIGMDDDFLSLMDDTGDTRDDLKCPGEDVDVGKEVRDAISNETDILVSDVKMQKFPSLINFDYFTEELIVYRSLFFLPAEKNVSSPLKWTPLLTNKKKHRPNLQTGPMIAGYS